MYHIYFLIHSVFKRPSRNLVNLPFIQIAIGLLHEWKSLQIIRQLTRPLQELPRRL
jgi:hypothetical protein